MALQTIINRYPVKKGTLETFAVKLMDKIIHASSPVSIERYIAVAVKALDNKKINGYIIQRFIDRVTLYLNNHAPADAQQESNMWIARRRLLQFREQLAAPAEK